MKAYLQLNSGRDVTKGSDDEAQAHSQHTDSGYVHDIVWAMVSNPGPKHFGLRSASRVYNKHPKSHTPDVLRRQQSIA